MTSAADEGGISAREKFSALGLMSLAHALIEDTILMMAIGGDIFILSPERWSWCPAFYTFHGILLKKVSHLIKGSKESSKDNIKTNIRSWKKDEEFLKR